MQKPKNFPSFLAGEAVPGFLQEVHAFFIIGKM